MTTLPLKSTFPSTPYRGIDHYRFVDHPIFFARRAETFELQRSVMMFKGMLLFGGSGVGKSSLIDAGLLPKMLETDFSPDRIRVQNRANEEIVIERISLNDDGKVPYLAPSLAEGITKDEHTRIVIPLKEFEKRLRSYSENHYPLLVLDQFEEVITLFEETPREPGSLQEILKRQQSLIDFFVGILHDDSLRVKVLFSFREDYLAKLTKLFLRAAELPNQYMRLLPPQKKALHDIIDGPFKKELVGHYKRRNAFSSELVNEITAQFEKRIEGDEINLSDVQIVCLQLWESDDPEKLFISRDVQGLLEDYYTGELDQFSEERHHIAIALLSHMLTVSNTRNFVSGVELIHMFQSEEELFSEERVPEETLKQVLKDLTGTRLVKRELRHKDFFYEIASESLVPWIIQKKAERQSILERRRLEEVTRRERQEERQRANQILKYWKWGAALIAVIMVLAIFLAYVTTQKSRKEQELKIQAQEAKKDADTKREEKEKIISTLTRLLKNPSSSEPLTEDKLSAVKDKLDSDKLTGIRLIKSLIQQDQFPVEQVPTLVGRLSSDRDPEIAVAATDLLDQAIESQARQRKLKDQADQEKLDAIQEMRNLMEKKSFPPELVLSLLGPTVDKESNPAISKAMRDLVKDALEQNSSLGAPLATAANSDPNLANILPARVYIEIETEQQADKAKSIKAELEKNGYIIPEFEVVTVRAPRRYELRYYRKADEPKAFEIVNLLKNLKLEVIPVYLKGYEDSRKHRPGHYELWFATQSKPGENWYLVISYSPTTSERRDAMLELISPITQQEGGAIETLSGHELKIGPYDQEQAKQVRKLLIQKDERLQKRVVLIRR